MSSCMSNWVDRAVTGLAVVRDGFPFPVSKWSEWSDDERRSYELRTVTEGVMFGLRGSRLSMVAEDVVRARLDAGELDGLVRWVWQGLVEVGEPVVLGSAYQMLNRLAAAALP